MAVYARLTASGSTNGRNVKVVATATPGTLLHTADATAQDEVYAWAYNSDTVARELTIEDGGVTSPDDQIKVTIQPKAGLELVLPGGSYTGSVAIRAFCAAAANVITIKIKVNRIT